MLCLPALILGAVLRLLFLVAIPEAFYGSDSPSYFQAADRLWGERHQIRFIRKRRWLYPMLLMTSPMLPATPARSIPIIQHLLGLATIFGIGWVAGNLTRLRFLWVPSVTVLAALLPQLLWDEHEVISDSVFLAAFVLTAALAMPYGRLLDRKRLFWFLLAAAAVPALKPHGRGIWLGCVLYAVLVTGNPLKWNFKCWGTILAAVFIFLSSGEKRQGDWLLLDSALPLVDLNAPKWKQYRDALRPLVLRARQESGQYAWDEKDYKKALGDGNPKLIDPVWANLVPRQTEYLEVCRGLAFGAIFAHPFTFAELTIAKIGIAFAHSSKLEEKMNPAAFWKTQESENSGRWLHDASQLGLFYQMDQPRYEKLVQERQARRNAIVPFLHAFSEKLAWLREYRDSATGNYYLGPGWLGVLAAFGFLVCLLPGRFAATSVLWLPAILYLVTVFAIGNGKGDYVQPVSWVGLVLAAIGLDQAIHAAHRLVSGLRAKAHNESPVIFGT